MTLNAISDAQAAYVHVPFCRHRCGYCNFTLIADRDDLQGAYLDALERELQQLGQPRPVRSLFVGGGTPTHLHPENRGRFLRLLQAWLPPQDTAAFEFSVESNPSDISVSLLESLAAAGVNRLSLGVQSFHAAALETLERDHSPKTAMQAIAAAREHMPQVSIDLIFGVPGQTLELWLEDVAAAIQANVSHMSTYGLTYEKGAAFWGRQQRNQLQPVSEELERQMYVEGIHRLSAAGFEHYEVSNFAQPTARCRHNVVYWQGGDYLAFGPGASRHYQGRRETNHRSVTTYIRRMLGGEDVVAERETLTPEQRASERLVFGLRMRDGIRRGWFAEQTGFEIDAIAGERLAEHVRRGFMSDDGERVWLTEEGLLLSDSLLVDFVL